MIKMLESEYQRHERLITVIDMKLNAFPQSPFGVYFYPDRSQPRLTDSEVNALMKTIEGQFENANTEAFTVLLRQYMDDKAITALEAYTAALIEKSYFYQILNGRHTPSRDVVIRVALALGLNLNESVRLLRALGYCFFGRCRRDIIIMECIEHNAGLYTAELLLNKYGEITLCNKSIPLAD